MRWVERVHSLNRIRSLRFFVLLWLIIPFVLILTIMLGAIVLIYQNSMIQLVLERHQQLANLAAVTVSQGIESNAHVLEALSTRPAMRDPSPEVRQSVFRQSADAFEDFNAGVVQVDAQGDIITASPNADLTQWQSIPTTTLLQLMDFSGAPRFSNVVTTKDGVDLILTAVPTTGADGRPDGAVIGGIALDDPDNFISTAIRKLTGSTPGVAYLVDEQGKVISHPEQKEIGQLSSDLSYIAQGLRGSHGGTLWNDPQGERYAGAEAVVSPSGWSLVVREPWEAIIAPSRRYSLLIAVFILLAFVGFFFLSWVGTRQVTAPIQNLCKSTRALATGDAIPPIAESRILELDQLRNSFLTMANDIAAYRDGLRHYVDAMTRSQEEERLRIARELHDETVQNLLAVYRRMELYSTEETDPQKQQQIRMLYDMVYQTLQGVRRISQDLRPMMLDDLGFVPAVQMLVRAAHEGQGGVPHVNLKIQGEARPMPLAHELALYRIVQEALNNIRKHARATSLEVTLTYQPDRVLLEIEDDGIGFSVPASFTELARAGNLGLMGIQERVWAVGGMLSVESEVGRGTVLKISVAEGPGLSV